ncbi:MAG: hypothetical protein DI539_05335 [Flavobacterium psychrophilum]|nr:MAG: hypothetical protein DI539_05335 [Flavobacterium psychrophilum]
METRPQIKIKPTQTDIILEVIGYVGLAALWIFVSVMYYKLPDIVPVHFNLAGEADGFGSKKISFLLPILASFQFLVLSVVQEYPEQFNYPVTITAENAEKQYTNAVRMMRAIRVVLVTVFLIVELYSDKDYLGLTFNGNLLLPLVLIVLIVPLSYFIIKSYRQR